MYFLGLVLRPLKDIGNFCTSTTTSEGQMWESIKKNIRMCLLMLPWMELLVLALRFVSPTIKSSVKIMGILLFPNNKITPLEKEYPEYNPICIKIHHKKGNINPVDRTPG